MRANIEFSTLPNGLKVVTDYTTEFDTVTLFIAVNVGSKNETSELHGISHFIEHMLFKGTENRTAKQLSEEVENMGALQNAFTSKEMTAYHIKCLKKDAVKSLEILADMVLNSTFPEDEITREKGVICQEISMYNDSPDDIVFDYFFKSAIPNHQIGECIIGTNETVNSFTKKMAQDYMKSYYTPDNMIIASCGNFSHKDLLKLSEEFFGKINTKKPKYQSTNPVFEGTELKKHKDSLEQTQFIAGYKSLNAKDEERFTANIVANVLGGGMSSRLFQRIREELGLVYTISAGNEMYDDIGIFLIYAGLNSKDLNLLQENLEIEIKKIKNELISDEEYARIINQTQAGIVMGLENTGSRARKLVGDFLKYGEYINPDDILEKIKNTTKKDIQRIANQIFSSSSSVCIYGNLANE